MKNFRRIKNIIYQIVEKTAHSPKNKFTAVWDHHIIPVVEHSLNLGKKLKADLEVLEIASLLHDYASITNYKFVDEHHIYGAKLAEEILIKLKVPQEEIKKIQNCIISHRGSIPSKRITKEEKILASADAMSHFTELASMFYLAYGVHKFRTKEGTKWLHSKLKRSWSKIMPEGKIMIKKDYLIAMQILKKALER